MRKSRYPHGWKVGRVTPVHKRGSVSVEANYRPVIVIDNLEGVFEGITKGQFESWVTNFIPDCQYGFFSIMELQIVVRLFYSLFKIVWNAGEKACSSQRTLKEPLTDVGGSACAIDCTRKA